MTRFIVWILSIAAMTLGAVAASGQAYPNQAVRIVTGPISGGSDIIARIIGAELSASLGQPVIVDNRPSGVIPFEVVARAAPDGYTLLVYASSVWNTTLVNKVSYDPVKDYAPITLATKYPSLVMVHPTVPVATVKELIALAKAKPGELNASTGSTGGAGNLALQLFKSMAGVDITRVPYSSDALESADLLSGRIQMTLGTGPEMSPWVKSGKLKALAITTAQPSPLFPGLPTVSATAIPGYEFVSVFAVLAPANTPAAVVNRLNREIGLGLSKPNVKQKIFDGGQEVAVGTPEELANAIKSDLARLGKALRESGVKVE